MEMKHNRQDSAVGGTRKRKMNQIIGEVRTEEELKGVNDKRIKLTTPDLETQKISPGAISGFSQMNIDTPAKGGAAATRQ